MNAPFDAPVPSQASSHATARQQEASDPGVSAFVAASAGSGKTKLLIDRLLRLMLAGAEPGRILCLTFTKAAAAEMALRLQKVLGEWVVLDDAALAAELKQRGIAPTAEVCGRARALFATVLDLPGGMRIDTIHAFCQSLLRRFPLEAQLAPHFRLMEDADSHAELEGARAEAVADADPATLAELAGQVTDGGAGRLVAMLRAHATDLAPILAMPGPARLGRLRRALGVRFGDDASIVRDGADWPGAATLRALVMEMQSHGSASERTLAEQMLDWLNLPPDLRAEHWDQWLGLVLTGQGAVRQPGGFCKSKWAKAHPTLADHCVVESERAYAVEDDRRALHVAALTDALLSLAAPVLAGFNDRKRHRGLLDYDDMIRRTSALLLDPGTAWVLFKLDGGLDHLLLDEVQDTAPVQWEIAGALTAEFFAGLGADRDAGRTVFAVGDRKQSIYSFQGADPAGFDQWRGRTKSRVAGAGGQFRDVELAVSFRSTTPVLALVDAVFADQTAAMGVVEPGHTLQHEADRAGHAGRVELWPLVPVPDSIVPEPWSVAERNHGLTSAPDRLADALARWIGAQVGHTPLPSHGRLIQAGDVLVLVRRRNSFAEALVRRLKALGVPVAGLDRLHLISQPAVQDLLALCDTLLLPEDDLSLACVLTSPLGDLTDDDLMALAVGRDGPLWDTLRRRAPERPVWVRALAMLNRLLARVDYVPPHVLLSEALGEGGGRARLLRRLGPEAAEPIDELLGAALDYAGSRPASLQGFVHWLRQSAAEVKREAEGAGGAVRIMTVHGAKGLQAPVVILPDTTSLPPDRAELVWPEPGLPLWSPRKELRCAAIERCRAATRQAEMEEYNRLLYVALTRAEDRLVVCGFETRRAMPDTTWYAAVARGMAALGAAAEPLADVGEPWPGEVLAHASPQRARPKLDRPDAAGATAPLPSWAGCAPDWQPAPPPPEPPRPTPLAPSRPDSIGLGIVPDAASPLLAGRAALERGTRIHGLLQHIPALPEAEQAAALARYPDDLAKEVQAVLDHPALSPLFGPGGRAEQPVTGLVGDTVITGTVDRLLVLPDRVVVADFKTNRIAPDRPEDTPVLYLRQMAAYRAVLRGVFPGRPVQCALVWTRTATVTPLPDALLDVYAPA